MRGKSVLKPSEASEIGGKIGETVSHLVTAFLLCNNAGLFTTALVGELLDHITKEAFSECIQTALEFDSFHHKMIADNVDGKVN